MKIHKNSWIFIQTLALILIGILLSQGAGQAQQNSTVPTLYRVSFSLRNVLDDRTPTQPFHGVVEVSGSNLLFNENGELVSGHINYHRTAVQKIITPTVTITQTFVSVPTAPPDILCGVAPSSVLFGLYFRSISITQTESGGRPMDWYDPLAEFFPNGDAPPTIFQCKTSNGVVTANYRWHGNGLPGRPNASVTDISFSLSGKLPNEPPTLDSPQATPVTVASAQGTVHLSVSASDDIRVSAVSAQITGPNGKLFNQPLRLTSGTATSGTYTADFPTPTNTSSAPQQFNVVCNATDNEGAKAAPTASVTFSVSPGPLITSPRTGAHPLSQYVSLTGTGTPGRSLFFEVDGADSLHGTTVDSDGSWEAVLYLGPRKRTIKALYSQGGARSNQIEVTPLTEVSPPKDGGVRYEDMLKADIIFSTGGVTQTLLYGAVYSHVALYVGGDSEGTPLIAEAVPQSEAAEFDQVRAVPLERSTIWERGDPVSIQRPVRPLTKQVRERIVSWVEQATSRHLPYWTFEGHSDGGDFKWFYKAWRYYNSRTGRPTNRTQFRKAVRNLQLLKLSTDKFICSTLVWRAYYEITSHDPSWDFSTPNRAGNGGILRVATRNPQVFLNAIGPYFVFPDTIANCGKLRTISAR